MLIVPSPSTCPICGGRGHIGSNLAASIGDAIINTDDGNIVVRDGKVLDRNVSATAQQPSKVISKEQAFERLGAAVRFNLDELERNSAQARRESNQFFTWTLIFAAVGFLAVIVAVVFLLTGQITAGIVSAVAGIIPEATAALFFTKDRELRSVIGAYHHHTLESQRMLTMIDLAETIGDPLESDRLKRELMMSILKDAVSPPKPRRDSKASNRAGQGTGQ